MKKLIQLLFCLSFVAFLFNSCKKTPGEGGNAQIKGKVWTEDWDDPFFTYISHEYPSILGMMLHPALLSEQMIKVNLNLNIYAKEIIKLWYIAKPNKIRATLTIRKQLR